MTDRHQQVVAAYKRHQAECPCPDRAAAGYCVGVRECARCCSRSISIEVDLHAAEIFSITTGGTLFGMARPANGEHLRPN